MGINTGFVGFCWALDSWVFVGSDIGLNFVVVKFLGLAIIDGVVVSLVVLDGVTMGLWV